MMTRDQFCEHVASEHGFDYAMTVMQPDIRPTVAYHQHQHDTMEIDHTHDEPVWVGGVGS
jgi:hypothetical protein